jgi:hypothetical protein
MAELLKSRQPLRDDKKEAEKEDPEIAVLIGTKKEAP